MRSDHQKLQIQWGRGGAYGSLTVPVKTLDDSEIKISSWKLAKYARFVMESPSWADGAPPSKARSAPYCQDIPLLGLVESLAGALPAKLS